MASTIHAKADKPKGKSMPPMTAEQALKAAPMAAKAQKSKELVIPRVNAKAISKDVGPRFVRSLGKAEVDIVQGEQLKAAGQQAKATAMSELTLAIVKAAKADTSIAHNLTACVDTSDDAKKRMALLNDQLHIAVGNREVVTIKNKKGEDIQRTEWSAAVRDLFPASGESTEVGTPGAAKNTLRQNVAHAMKDAAKAALYIIDRDIKADIQKQTGQLKISGPAVKKMFGADNIVLDEKQKIIPTDKNGKAKGDPIELKEKASFAALRRGAEQEIGGNVPKPRVQRTMATTTPDKAIITIANSLVDALSAYKGKVTDEMKTALNAAYSAIDVVI